MFSGKTEELIRRLKRAAIAKQIVLVYKPNIDNRYGVGIVSHNSVILDHPTLEIPCSDVDKHVTVGREVDVVAFDEAQFFDESIVTTIKLLLKQGKRVICAGLDLDSYQRPFGHIPELLAMAHDITKLTAICSICQEEASKTCAIIPFDGKGHLVAAREAYTARCDKCFTFPPT